ncbi:ATP-binding protein [Streptomyces sp. NPDC002994]|uniref:ATP-binding protein n=1 Tax=Streptomyces sp. NPDC002994 TaxID=3154441 RepID=UPI0033B33A8A
MTVGELPSDGLDVGDAVVLRWGDDPRCVGCAWVALSDALMGWGLSAVEDSALVILSELLTNAGRHARVPGQDIETRNLRMLGGLRIEVHDGSCKLPSLSTLDGDGDSGRGLWLVDQLADRWDVCPRAELGKVVWAEISTPAGSGDQSGG